MQILLVEDDSFFQNFYSTKLKENQFDVQVASNGEEALEKLKTIKPDIILLDLIMPRKNGFDVLREKSQDPSIASIPTLVFSTLGQEKDIQQAMSLGATGYVNKTFFDFDNLLRKIFEITVK